MPDMYAVYPLKPPSTYPFDVSRLSTGSALTAAHFCQTATKVSKKALPYHTAASPRLAGTLTPVLLWGHTATGHPWPIAALPASMPVDPLHRTSSRPPGRAGRSKALRPEAADRPACLAARSVSPEYFLCGSGQARLPQGDMSVENPAFKQAGRPPRRLLILIYPPHREAERRFCAVGPRSGTARREPERSEGRTPGARPFWFLLWLFDKRDSP